MPMHIEKIKTVTASKSVILSENSEKSAVVPTERQLNNFKEFQNNGNESQFLLDIQMGASLGAACQKLKIKYDTLKKWLGYMGEEFDEFRGKMAAAVADCAVVAEQTLAMRSPQAWLTQGPGRLLAGNVWVNNEAESEASVGDEVQGIQPPSQDDMMRALQEARKIGLDLNDIVDGGLTAIEVQNDNDNLLSMNGEMTPSSETSNATGPPSVGYDPPLRNGTPTAGGSNTKDLPPDLKPLADSGTPSSKGHTPPIYNFSEDPLNSLINKYSVNDVTEGEILSGEDGLVDGERKMHPTDSPSPEDLSCPDNQIDKYGNNFAEEVVDEKCRAYNDPLTKAIFRKSIVWASRKKHE
jgi:hypothetical protein